MSNTCLCIDIFLATLGIIFGLSGCITFFIYQNIVAGTWAFFSGLFASICFHLHYLMYRNRMYHSPAALRKFADLGIVVAGISLSFFVWYLYADLYWRLPMLPIKESYVIMAVWSFMTGKWGIILYFISLKYGRIISNDYSPLIST